MNNCNFADSVYELRKSIGLSQNELGERLGVSGKEVSEWETGKVKPNVDILRRLSDMFGISAEIASFLGEPEPFEIERKFLIAYPDIKALEANPTCRRVEIIQTYLKSENGDEVRVRQRGENGDYVYFLTTKRKVTDVKRVEIERRLSKDEYLTYLMDADTSKKQIRKTRYCLTYKNQYFEIDIYPFWDKQAIMEIELADENAQIEFPDFIKVIKEVTDDESYKNSSLAQKTC